MTKNYNEALDRVISNALNNKENNHNLKKGISKHTEHYAYEEVLPLIDEGYNETVEMIGLRLSAMIATSNLPQNNNLNFGKWAQKVASSNSENVKTRLVQIVNLDIENTLTAINRIITMSSNSSLGFNWYGLTRTLLFWGNGQTDASLKVRQSILRDYFIANRLQDEDNSVVDDKDSEVSNS